MMILLPWYLTQYIRATTNTVAVIAPQNMMMVKNRSTPAMEKDFDSSSSHILKESDNCKQIFKHALMRGKGGIFACSSPPEQMTPGVNQQEESLLGPNP